MRKWIVFKASGEEEGWEERAFAHNHSLTNILCEHFDSSNKGLPERGYRPTERVRVESEHDSQKNGWSTHYKDGDWVVDRVEVYEPVIEEGSVEYTIIVVCWCVYDPIDATLKRNPDRQVSVHSFGDDVEAYENYQRSQSSELVKV